MTYTNKDLQPNPYLENPSLLFDLIGKPIYILEYRKRYMATNLSSSWPTCTFNGVYSKYIRREIVLYIGKSQVIAGCSGINRGIYEVSELGKTWFTSEEEAQAALEKIKNER